MNKKVEVLILVVLYLISLYIWTLPIQKNRMPYGEVDAVSHFTVGDYMAQTDKAIIKLPYFMDFRYGSDNQFKPHYLWYPPPFHMNFAIMEIFGGERILPVFLFNSILSSIIVLVTYFVVRKLFGFLPALLSSFLMVFSLRDIMVYLWGQWPERISFYFVPLVIYCFYKYMQSRFAKEEKPIYMYIMALLLSVNFLMHPNGARTSIIILAFVSLFFLIKERKLPFKIKHISLAVLLFILVICMFPLQSLNAFVSTQKVGVYDDDIGDYSRLLYWFKIQKSNKGTPADYFYYSKVNGGYWTLPLLFVGLIYLALRRKNQDILLLAWFVGLYVVLHLDVFGLGVYVHRTLSSTAHIFYPIMAIGTVYLASFIPVAKKYKNYVKYGLVSLFILLVIFFNGKAAYSHLNGAYQGIVRITPMQLEAAEWTQANLPEDADIESIGTFNLAKRRWIQFLAHRHINKINGRSEQNITSNYIMFDYSDPLILMKYYGDPGTQLQLMQLYEQSIQDNITLVYDKNNIKVYKIKENKTVPEHNIPQRL